MVCEDGEGDEESVPDEDALVDESGASCCNSSWPPRLGVSEYGDSKQNSS